jgi:hypothetical protein
MEKQQIIQERLRDCFKNGISAEINVTVLGEASYSIRVTVEEIKLDRPTGSAFSTSVYHPIYIDSFRSERKCW